MAKTRIRFIILLICAAICCTMTACVSATSPVPKGHVKGVTGLRGLRGVTGRIN